MNITKKTFIGAVLLGLFMSLSFYETETFAQEQGRRPQGPPPEAIEACEGLSAGASVEFTGRRGETLEATCRENDGQLAAVPDNMPEGFRH